MKLLFIKTMLFSLVSVTALSQGKEKTFNFKKGEVLDIMLLSLNENSGKLYDRYKKIIFPIGVEYTYEPQLGFSIKELTLGNHSPNSLILAKWKNKEKREGFLKNIVKRILSFHQQRRELFRYFGLTYYKMKNDLNFSVNTEKFNVANAFWGKDKNSSSKFYKSWERKVKKSGGKILLKLENGISPTGYYYNPDVFYIIAWKNKIKFEFFSKDNPLSTYEVLKNVHQFIIK